MWTSRKEWRNEPCRFWSCEEMLAAARSQKITLAEAVLRSDLEESRLTEEQAVRPCTTCGR